MTGLRPVKTQFVAALGTVCACFGCGAATSDDADFGFVGVDITGYEVQSPVRPMLTAVVQEVARVLLRERRRRLPSYVEERGNPESQRR